MHAVCNNQFGFFTVGSATQLIFEQKRAWTAKLMTETQAGQEMVKTSTSSTSNVGHSNPKRATGR